VPFSQNSILPARIHWQSICLKERFGQKVWRLGIDAGFTCPHRSSDRLQGGCRFCAPDGNVSAYQKGNRRVASIEAQLERAIKFTRRRYHAKAFFLYFQAYSCTNAPLAELELIYEEAIDAFSRTYQKAIRTEESEGKNEDAFSPANPLKGIIVSTRPDCFDMGKAALLARYARRGFEVWIEFGLQSAHDDTLTFLHRNHTVNDYLEAMKIAEHAQLRRTTHLICGLPGESRKMMLETAHLVASTATEGVKFHDFRIPQGSAFARSFQTGEITQLHPLRLPALLADCLEIMPPSTEIMRLSSDFRPDECIDIHQPLDKHLLARLVDEELARRNSFQGLMFKELR